MVAGYQSTEVKTMNSFEMLLVVVALSAVVVRGAMFLPSAAKAAIKAD